MTSPKRTACEMRRTMPASLEAVEAFSNEFRAKCEAILDRKTWFAAELLIREALTNAVVHGSHRDAAKTIRCSLRISNRRLTIAVCDSGEGFDWRAARQRRAASSACSGRGIEILMKYASSVRFNDCGNAVVIVKRFS